MKKLCTVSIGLFFLIAAASPVWAHQKSDGNHRCPTKNDTHYGHLACKADKHKMKALKQFRELKKKYNRSTKAARQMFMEFLGSNLPSQDADIDKIRAEYEQQIAALNESILSYQQQLEAAQAACQQQLEASQATCQQQLADLEAANQAALAELSADCLAQKDAAYNDGLAAGAQSCASQEPAGEAQLVTSWSTGGIIPQAIDVDGAGNTVVVGKYSHMVATYDGAGTQIGLWASDLISMPVDMALDSNGNVYILDENSDEPVMKFSSDGQQLAFSLGSDPVYFPASIFIDSNNTIYLTDMGGTNGGRIRMLDTSGASQGTLGDVPGLTDEFRDIAVDEQNQAIYVVTRSNDTVVKFDMTGNLIDTWQGGLNSPNSIAAGHQGQVFVANTNNSTIEQYDTNGNLMYTIGASMLNRPKRIVVDDSGKLYVADETLTIRVYQ